MAPINTVTILGSSSGRNAGDAALLSGIMDAIDKACEERLLYEIPTYRPDFIWKSYENKVRPVSMLPWHGTVGMLGVPTYRSLGRCDLALIYDAMLFDRKLYNPLTNYMSSVYYMLPRVKRRNALLGFYNAGTGPVNTPQGRKMLREIADMMDFVTVRDEDSLNLLRELGVKNESVLITADAALSVKPASPARVSAILHKLGLSEAKEILAVNVNSYLNSWAGTNQRELTKDEFASTYAKALDRVSDKLGVPLLFVCTQHSDVGITQQLMSGMRTKVQKALLTNVDHSHYDIRGVFEKVSLQFAMRLHANILCSASTTPICALAFQKKVTSYYKLLGIPDHVMSFNDFSESSIEGHVLHAWERRHDIRAQLSKRIPFLQRESFRAAEVISWIRSGVAPAEAIRRAAQEQNAPRFSVAN